MNDPMSLARSARENLAHGLAALQSPGVPPQVMEVAEPIAFAMSALHRIESTNGAALTDSGPVALDSLRRALAMLQSQTSGHPAVAQAMEAIAGSLSLVHTLNQSAAPVYPQAAHYAQQPSYAQPAPAAYPQHAAYPQQAAAPAYPQQPAPAPYAQPAPQPVAPQYAPTAYAQPQPPAPAYPPPAPAASAARAPAPGSQPQWGNPAPAQAAPAWAPPPPPPPGPTPASRPLDIGRDAVRVEAELGAHSATNFYKGLSGNDVIDSGGIFIATYNIPEIGQNVVIHVSMPGGYEFEAAGIVRWTRDMPHSGADSSPGFGAQFTQISPEGRQLVYRYVRNREPLFHDDL